MAFSITHPEWILIHSNTLGGKKEIPLIPRKGAFGEFNRVSMGERTQQVGQITQESKGVDICRRLGVSTSTISQFLNPKQIC